MENNETRNDEINNDETSNNETSDERSDEPQSIQLSIPPLGFTNTGAICYFNALVQSLLSCKQFIAYICREKRDSVFFLFFKFIAIDKKWDPFFTSKLLHVMGGFAPNQSSNEYFLKLCDYLKMDDLFSTKTETTKVCKECGKEGDKVMDTSVFTVIDNSVDEFCETTRDVEGYYCDSEKCKKKVTVAITTRIREISPIMVFSFNKYFQKRMIPYPKGFNIDGDKEYRLVSTIEHHGVLGGGHYFCRTVRNGTLLRLDDNGVGELGDIDPTDNTYMVFYERVR
jgi:ubiquitin C-terminal hydrolase